MQALSILTQQWKDLLVDFVTRLPVLTNWKGKNYDSILVIVNRLIKIVYYEPVKVTINVPRLANVVVWNHGLSNLIITNRGLLFTSKFWALLCYFFGIKRRLSIARVSWKMKNLWCFLYVTVRIGQHQEGAGR